jgi:pyruvate/2-oxoglutarate dehydrogenase complex dihydrolipoamide acyltransferase (E2) component
MTQSWTTAPHFYLFREVTVGRLVSWRDLVTKATGARVTYTDLLVQARRGHRVTPSGGERIVEGWRDRSQR